MNQKKIVFHTTVFFIGFALVSIWSIWIVTRPPQYTLGHTPDMYFLSAEDVVLTAPDGTQLSAWYIPRLREEEDVENEDDPRVIILLHGYPSEKSDMLAIGRTLANDFSLLLLDLRYFGESEGSYTTLGIREREDIRVALDLLEERGYGSVGIFGFSLGGALSILSAAHDDRIDAVAAYAPYSNLRTLGHEAYRHLWILKYPLVELMNIWGRVAFGEWFTNIAPENAARSITIPVLIIHSKDDEQISFRHAERLQEAFSHNPNAALHSFEGAQHGILPHGFSSMLREFFQEALPGKE